MLGLLFIACSGSLEVTPFPSTLDFGEVDFHQPKPAEGYLSTELSLTNTGDKDVSLEIISFDFQHLCLEGYTAVPATLNSISPASSFTLLVSVCDYIEESGERDDLLTGNIEVNYGGDSSLIIPWNFTPILDIGEDSGL